VRILIVILVFVIIATGFVFLFKDEILQFFVYSAESVIKENLPPYVTLGRLVFDPKNQTLNVEDFGIKNPEGFHNKYLAKIGTIECRYKMQGENILDGIEVTQITAIEPVINIERRRDGIINVNLMGDVMAAENQAQAARKAAESAETAEKKEGVVERIKEKIRKRTEKVQISDIIKLTNEIQVRDGKVVFIDDYIIPRRRYKLTFEDFEGNIVLGLRSDYTQVMSVHTRGSGFVNGDPYQKIDWVVSFDPRASELDMSNRYTVENVDIMLFKPYYDEYSPIDIRSGRVFGTFVFDFNHGNIGSNNEVRLRQLKFTEKEGRMGSQFWGGSVTDIINYLRSSSGDVIFDFKIKGSIQHPEFFPGPRVKQAIQNMIVQRVSDAFRQPEEGAVQGQQAEPQSDTERVYNVIRGLLQDEQ